MKMREVSSSSISCWRRSRWLMPAAARVPWASASRERPRIRSGHAAWCHAACMQEARWPVLQLGHFRVPAVPRTRLAAPCKPATPASEYVRLIYNTEVSIPVHEAARASAPACCQGPQAREVLPSSGTSHVADSRVDMIIARTAPAGAEQSTCHCEPRPRTIAPASATVKRCIAARTPLSRSRTGRLLNGHHDVPWDGAA